MAERDNGERNEARERIPTTVSVGILLVPASSPSRLVMVRHGEHEWSLPSGGIELGEIPNESLIRELEEETGIKGEHLAFDGQIIRGEHFETFVKQKPVIFIYPKEGKTSVGFIYRATYHGPKLPHEGWPNQHQGESVGYVKPIQLEEVCDLILNTYREKGVGRLYRPEYNTTPLLSWVLYRSSSHRAPVDYIHTKIEQLYDARVPGLIRTDSTTSGWALRESSDLVLPESTRKRMYGYISGGDPLLPEVVGSS